MEIRVQFFSQLRNLAGTQELKLELPDKSTVSDLLEKLYQRMPALRSHDNSILVGVGVEFAKRDYQLKAGDDISIMPPVQGG